MSKSRHIPKPKDRPYWNFGKTVKLPLSDRTVTAASTNGDHTRGNRGIAKDRKVNPEEECLYSVVN